MKEAEKEHRKLLYVELPSLLQRIIHTTLIDGKYKEIYDLDVKEIKKIVNTECEAALSYFID